VGFKIIILVTFLKIKNMYQISKPIGFVMMFIAAIMWLRNWQLNFENADLKKKIQKLEETIKNSPKVIENRQLVAPISKLDTLVLKK
jgi:epoxyqueuosine reductase QueG